MRRYRNLDPKEIIARFNSKCAETGNEIKKGDPCIYYPSSKQVFHPESKQAKEFRDMKFDDMLSDLNY